MDFYIFEDSSDFGNLPLLNIEWTLILQFCFLDTYLSYDFLIDASIFTTIDEKKEEQRSTLQIFLKDVWEKKNSKFITQLTLNNLNIQKIELLKIKLISQTIPSKQNYLVSKTNKKSDLITRTLIALNKFVFHPNNYLAPLRIWFIDRESTVAAFISFY